jgi:hypothetical protein
MKAGVQDHHSAPELFIMNEIFFNFNLCFNIPDVEMCV